MYRSGILVEIEGVEGQIRVLSLEEHNDREHKTKSRRSPKGSSAKGENTDRPQSTPPLVHDPGGHSSDQPSAGRDDHETLPHLPTTIDLAQSFLETEPAKERAQIQNALAKSRYLHDSQISEAGDDDLSAGIGTGISLPGFVADFLKGVGDRLQLRVKNVQLDLAMKVENPSGVLGTSAASAKWELVIFRLSIEDVEIEGVTSETTVRDHVESGDASSSTNKSRETSGYRRISLHNLQGMLLSDASLFGILSQYSGPASPVVTNSGAFQNTASNLQHSSNRLHSISTSSSAGIDMEASGSSSSLRGSPASSSKHERSMFESIIEPFDESTHEGNEPAIHDLTISAYESSLVGSQYQDIFPEEYLLAQVATTTRGQNIEDSDTLPTPTRYSSFVYPGAESLSKSTLSPHSSSVSDHFADSTSPATIATHTMPDLFSSSHSTLAESPLHAYASPGEGSINYRPNIDVSINEVQTARGSASPIETSPDDSQSSGTCNLTSPPKEDLTQSKIFSHEEAESMYMSAISHKSGTVTGDQFLPGVWDVSSSESDGQMGHIRRDTLDTIAQADVSKIISSSSTGSGGDLPSSHMLSPSETVRTEHASPKQTFGEVEKQTFEESDESNSWKHGSGTSQGSDTSLPKSEVSTRIIKQFISIDVATIELPQAASTSKHNGQNSHNRSDVCGRESAYPEIPGGLSDSGYHQHVVHASSETPRNSSNAQLSAGAQPEPEIKMVTNECGSTSSLRIGKISMSGDLGLMRLSIMALQTFQNSKVPRYKSGSDHAISETTFQRMILTVENVSCRFVDILRGKSEADSQATNDLGALPVSEQEPLFITRLDNVNIEYSTSGEQARTELSLGTFEFGYATSCIISFDSSLKMRESTRDVLAPTTGDLTLTVVQRKKSMDVRLTTLPLHVSLDLARLDETFSWYGGLSTVLGLGSSMMSTVTVMDAKSKPTSVAKKKPRGVHFSQSEQDGLSDSVSDHEQHKVTVRIGGILFDLLGKVSSLRLESTAMKLVSREEGLGVQVDKLKFSGLYFRSRHDEPAITVQLLNTRLEYLSIPKEVDLARLLALLSPSRDKYELDDDILLDTLLRQRRQGGVVRITIDRAEGSISKLHELSQFGAIAEELSKLSTVAKYLPEDDRPGVLTLCLVRDIALQLQVNNEFGLAQLYSNNAEVAHVTLPPLMSLGVKTIHIQRQGEEELIGEASPLHSEFGAQSPMVMARLIGDEMEPTIKIKLWNMRIEYHVTTVIALLGLTDNVTDETIADMANSLATLTGRLGSDVKTPKLSSQSSSSSEKSSGLAKLMRFDIAIRDSIIGLNPRDMPSRGLFVLTNTTIIGTFPRKKDADLKGAFEIKKASLMVIDNIKNLTHAEDVKQDPLEGSNTQIQDLSNAGYVPVSYISAAKINLQIVSSGKDNERSVDLEIRDDLFVLESCADSTQTLLSILNGLKPAFPASQELKYRTEVVPIENMLASFSGDAYTTVVSNENGDDHPLEIDDGDMVDDELPQNLEYVSSFYNPDPAATSEDIANSMLEEDLDQLAAPPTIREIGDRRLLQSFQEQCEVAPGGEPLSFQDDHFGASSTVEGNAQKWNSDRNTYNLVSEVKIRGSPFQVRVRDVHIIWNLFDGYDWQHTRDTISQAVADVESKAVERLARNDKRRSLGPEEEHDSVIGDFLFNSIYIGVPANRDPRELTRQINRNLDDLVSETGSYATSTTVSGSPSRQSYLPKPERKKLRLHRSKRHKLTFELRGVSLDMVVFSPGFGETTSSIDIRVRELEIFDHVPTSTWKKFATYMHDAGERESGTSMIHVEILNVKPVPELAASEIILKVTVDILTRDLN